MFFTTNTVIVMVDSRAVDPRCQPMRIPWCLGVYDAVIFPNFLGHQNQEDAYYAMHKLWPLIQTECSPQILHYLCRLYAPQCPYFAADRDASYFTYHPQQYRPPCEDACVRVRHDCYPIMAQHHIHWPAELECHRLRHGDCIETPQIEVDPTTQRPEVREPPPESTTEMMTTTTEEMTTTEVMTTTMEVTTMEPTPEPVKVEESSESPESKSVEQTEEPTPTPETVTVTVTTIEDGLVEMTEPTDDDDDDDGDKGDEETTSHATIATISDEEETTPEPVTTEAVTEPEETPATSPYDLEDGSPEESTSTAATDREPETTVAQEEAESISPDATTGSLLGISPVIQEEETTTLDPTDDDDDGSGDDDETTTIAAVAEPEPEPVVVDASDAAEEPTTQPAAAAPVEETSEDDDPAKVIEATVDPQAIPEQDVDAATSADDSSLTTTNGADIENESPRSDRAVSGASTRSNYYVKMMSVYLTILSVIFHRCAYY